MKRLANPLSFLRMPRSLRWQLIASVWIGVVAVMLPFSLYHISHDTKRAIKGQLGSLQDHGQLTKYIVERWTKNIDDLMQILATAPPIRRLDGALSQDYFVQLERLYPLRSWRLVTRSGELIAGTNVNIPMTPEKLLLQPYVQQSLQGKYYIDVISNCQSNSACYLHSVPIYSPGTTSLNTKSDIPVGVLIMEINLKDTAEDSGIQGEFSRIYTSRQSNSSRQSLPNILSLQRGDTTGLEVLLVDNEGRVVFPLSTINDRLSVLSPASLLAGVWGPIIKTGLTAGETAKFQKVYAAGTEFFTYSQVVDDDWSVVVASDTNSSMAEVYSDVRYLVLMGLLFLVIISLVIAAVCQRAAIPIQRAAATVKAFSVGNFEARIESDRDDEVGNLFKNINNTGASLRQMINERLLHAVTDKQIETAKEIQKQFLVSENLSSDSVQIAAESQPAYEIGADWYDVIHTIDTVYIVVADVCDKGIPSALFMSVFRSLLRFSLDSDDAVNGSQTPASRLAHTMARVNSYMAENHGLSAMFATIFMAAYHSESKQLDYINAGHEKPCIIRTDGSLVSLDVTGPALGIFPSAQYKVKQVHFETGDILFAFTDGLIDARSPEGDAFGISRVAAMLSDVKAADCNVSDLLQVVVSAVNNHTKTAEQFDDMTILIMKSGSA